MIIMSSSFSGVQKPSRPVCFTRSGTGSYPLVAPHVWCSSGCSGRRVGSLAAVLLHGRPFDLSLGATRTLGLSGGLPENENEGDGLRWR